MSDTLSLESLETHLRALVPDVQIQVIPAHELLIYITNSIMVGFCVAESQVEERYKSSYEAFKNAFGAKAPTRLEPSFVLCVDSIVKDIEKLSSSIETDVYFCRKYVLSSSGDTGRMLSHLPFLPLNPIGVLGPRPETAQTFLHQKGVPAELAKHIAVPAQRSAAAIVDLCVSGHYGEFNHPEKVTSTGREVNRVVQHLFCKTLQGGSARMTGFRV